ncbi:class I mannose-6-phosphate isomerase [Deinococcus sp. KNUC1210]|uniref:type I phosphomannose isomerase catalytic subunit n=1 Tax=Deinococcus sp. KNUC1210 TaxID=2917691 RepID=UPI001EEF8EBF|nr:type I phosphomannose isomerase catalytic subunit [Deinococcus sp. KNUC1210]ULH15288.1 class I mannose-6-phosphate isomerase [Deinococcus sp. KNUC1210]
MTVNTDPAAAPVLPQTLFLLEPQYRERVWGGQRLLAHTPPIGEAWIAHGESVVGSGAAQGHTLDALLRGELAGLDAASLLGTEVAAHTSGFPLLIKLLDCADWLSVQVHPNDEQASTMVGPGMLGKTEAWHFLEVEPGAEILAGVTRGTSAAELAAAIRGGTVLDVSQRHGVQAGDTAFIPAGTLHALGPGMLLYEVQEASDTTYRVYDWDRPASAGRALHIEESVAVTDPALRGDLRRAAETHGQGVLTSCEYFVLEGETLSGGAEQATTGGQHFHLITVVEGAAALVCGSERLELGKFQTALVAGAAGAYQLSALEEGARVLRSSVPAAAH